MNINQAIQYGKNLLSQFEHLVNANSKIDTEFLLAFVLNKNFTWLKTWPEYELTIEQDNQFKQLLKRRGKGEPIAYITGSKDFWNLTLKTNQSTLIPRAETELLVELSLEELSTKPKATVLDLGTGTGAIALAIASERAKDKIYAVDFNLDAVKLATENARLNQINNVSFAKSDWFKSVPNLQFDLIVANPPYIAKGDPHLSKGDLIFEPASALVASGDGLDDIRHIAKTAKLFLVEGGLLQVEHGYEQGEKVRDIFNQNGFQNVMTKKDLLNHDRVTQGRFLSC